MHAQRRGDIKSYAMITAEADKIKVKIIEIEDANKT
jgi:hypothetical protein